MVKVCYANTWKINNKLKLTFFKKSAPPDKWTKSFLRKIANLKLFPSDNILSNEYFKNNILLSHFRNSTPSFAFSAASNTNTLNTFFILKHFIKILYYSFRQFKYSFDSIFLKLSLFKSIKHSFLRLSLPFKSPFFVLKKKKKIEFRERVRRERNSQGELSETIYYAKTLKYDQ